jgi:hypothetical protein
LLFYPLHGNGESAIKDRGIGDGTAHASSPVGLGQARWRMDCQRGVRDEQAQPIAFAWTKRTSPFQSERVPRKTESWFYYASAIAGLGFDTKTVLSRA